MRGERKWGFSAEEEKEPSLCPENTALLSRRKDKDRNEQTKTGPSVGAGPKDQEALAPWLLTGGPRGERGAVYEHSRANT